MDALAATLARHEEEIATGWLKRLEAIGGPAFGGSKWTDPAKELRIALKALIAILESADTKPAEEQAARLARLPSQRGAGIMATVRGCYAIFEPLRAVLERAYVERPNELPSDVVRLRDAVATLTGVLATAHLKQGLTWQDEADRFARQRLNGPLGKLVSDLQTFQAAAAEHLPAPQQESLRGTVSFGRDVQRAAEGLFILHRLGEGRYDAANGPVPVAETLAPAAEDARRRASFGNRTLLWKAPVPALGAVGNADILRRAFALLLLRAIDDTPEGNTVRAEVLDDPEAVRIVVRDEGAGEAPADGRGITFEHTFARMAAEHMDGRFDVFHEPGRGTMVTLKLRRVFQAPPAKPGPAAVAGTAPAAPARPEPAPAEPGGGFKITHGTMVPGGGPAPADPGAGIKITRDALPPGGGRTPPKSS
jgi:signal transduction histidine kinase